MHVKEVQKKDVLITWHNTDLVPKPLIPTHLEVLDKEELASSHNAPWILSHTEDTPLEPHTPHLSVHLTVPQSSVLLMLPTGLLTEAESSPTAPTESITLSYLLDIQAHILLSKTLGVVIGVNLDISD